MAARYGGTGTLVRKRTLLREKVERESKAPRYVGLTTFSEMTGFDRRNLGYWLRSGYIWVPTPAVLFGEKRSPVGNPTSCAPGNQV